MRSEIKMLEQLHHELVVRTANVLEDDRCVFILMEYLAGGMLLPCPQAFVPTPPFPQQLIRTHDRGVLSLFD